MSAALKHAKLDIRASDYFHDCVLAVCLLQIDEPKVIFVHRSFQEYFTAKFVSSYGGPKLAAMLDWLARRSYTDNTFLMTAQLNLESVVRTWGLPKVLEFKDQCNNYITEKKYTAILREAGINALLINLETGDIKGWGIENPSALAVLESALRLSSPNITNYETVFSGNIYSGKRFGNLNPPTQSLLRIRTNSSGSTMLMLGDFDEPGRDVSIQSIAEDLLSKIEHAAIEMTSFLRERDEFVEIIDLVLPEEAGASTPPALT